MEDSEPIPHAILVGILLATLCALKTVVVLACGLFVLLYHCTRLASAARKRQAAGEAALAAAVALALLGPWMIAMHSSSGRFFYPILGKGYHGTAHSDFISAASDLHTPRRIVLELLNYASQPTHPVPAADFHRHALAFRLALAEEPGCDPNGRCDPRR
jgi:4-amino-4-deoxy-L-arabinose transferase-like glycosyltransferase